MVPFQLVRGKTQLSQTRMPLLIIVHAQSASGLDTQTIKRPWVPWNTRIHSIRLYVPYIPPLPCHLSDCDSSLKESVVPYSNHEFGGAHPTGTAGSVDFQTQVSSVSPQAPVCTQNLRALRLTEPAPGVSAECRIRTSA